MSAIRARIRLPADLQAAREFPPFDAGRSTTMPQAMRSATRQSENKIQVDATSGEESESIDHDYPTAYYLVAVAGTGNTSLKRQRCQT